MLLELFGKPPSRFPTRNGTMTLLRRCSALFKMVGRRCCAAHLFRCASYARNGRLGLRSTTALPVTNSWQALCSHRSLTAGSAEAPRSLPTIACEWTSPSTQARIPNLRRIAISPWGSNDARDAVLASLRLFPLCRVFLTGCTINDGRMTGFIMSSCVVRRT